MFTNRILFVDDELAVLEGLRLRLQPLERAWAMTFVDTGAQALVELQRHPYDVLVSDIRMPGMQGTRLLRTVSERWPQTIRVALSGALDHAPTQLVPVAHQFLGKPCQPPLLEDTLERCLRLRDLVGESALRALVGKTQRLRPLRRTLGKLQSLLANESTTARDLAQLVALDTVLAAKLLQIVNTAFFRPGRPVGDLEEAIRRLGSSTLRQLIVSPEVFGQWPPTGGPPLDLERLQMHINIVASVTRALTTNTPFAEDAFLAAILHDVGYWLLAQERPRELQNAIELAHTEGVPVHEAERRVLGSSHAELGAYLLGLWGFPDTIVNAVACHHCPGKLAGKPFDAAAALAVAIAIASSLAGSEDSNALPVAVGAQEPVGPEFLQSIPGAPFSWGEARELASNCLHEAALH